MIGKDWIGERKKERKKERDNHHFIAMVSFIFVLSSYCQLGLERDSSLRMIVPIIRHTHTYVCMSGWDRTSGTDGRVGSGRLHRVSVVLQPLTRSQNKEGTKERKKTFAIDAMKGHSLHADKCFLLIKQQDEPQSNKT